MLDRELWYARHDTEMERLEERKTFHIKKRLRNEIEIEKLKAELEQSRKANLRRPPQPVYPATNSGRTTNLELLRVNLWSSPRERVIVAIEKRGLGRFLRTFEIFYLQREKNLALQDVNLTAAYMESFVEVLLKIFQQNPSRAKLCWPSGTLSNYAAVTCPQFFWELWLWHTLQKKRTLLNRHPTMVEMERIRCRQNSGSP